MPLQVQPPVELRSYLSSVDGVQVYMWKINCESLPPETLLTQFKFRLCIDSVGSFEVAPPFDGSTGNLRCFVDDDAITGFGIGQFGADGFGIGGVSGGSRGFFALRKGQLVIAYEILMPPRQQAEETPYWWKVKVESPDLYSDYTDPQLISRDQSEHSAIAETMFERYPDEHVYTKDKKSTYAFTVAANEHARQIERMKFEAIRTKKDIYLDTVRDEHVYDNFGSLIEFTKPTSTTPQEYREQMIQIREAFELSGTMGALRKLIAIFACAEPTVTFVRSLTGWRWFNSTDQLLQTKLWHIKDPANEPAFEGYGGNKPRIVLWSKADKSHGVIMKINNPLNTTFDLNLLKGFIYKLTPAYLRIMYQA